MVRENSRRRPVMGRRQLISDSFYHTAGQTNERVCTGNERKLDKLTGPIKTGMMVYSIAGAEPALDGA